MTCRSCGGASLETILAFGEMPLANALVRPGAPPEPRYPLTLAYCRACTLVQILETLPRETMFLDYVYFSSYADSMVKHAEGLAEGMIRERGLGPRSLVVEAGSNDGYLLQFFLRRGVKVLGVEPAENIARVANEKGIRTIAQFFDAGVARRLGERADAFLGLNVLAHVSDLHGFLDGVRDILKADGVAVFEVPYVKEMVERDEFDTIYHEHLCYFSVTSASRLLARHGLAIVRAERLEVHGGSLRLTAEIAPGRSADGSVDAFLRAESGWTASTLEAFGRRVESMRGPLVEALRGLKRQGKRIAGYGAAAKATVLMNYFGIDGSIIDFVCDRNPHKQGLSIPGVRVPIRPPEALAESRPDYVILFAWNIAPEVLAQQEPYRRSGGKFIVPVPSMKVIE